VERVDLCDLFPLPQFNNYSYGTGIWGSILAVVIVAISGNVTVWRFDVRGATQNFQEFARNNMNTYFKSRFPQSPLK